MPRPKPPPTPIGSTDLTALEVKSADMESMFALPPPAIRSEAQANARSSKTTHSRSASSTTLTPGTPPFSPQDNASSPRHKRTASGVVKATMETKSAGADTTNSYSLPPPPSRARKIIQMKPKGPSTNHSSPTSDAEYVPPGASSTTSAGVSMSSSKASTAGNVAPAAVSSTSSSKRKQPSATSAAGRKIARKTAHSIIERRRRSKMNEEFGVLKDMIPACEGVEMHKLAILQAGIDYVRYLEGCVTQLKEENLKLGGHIRLSTASRMQIDTTQDDDGDEESDEEDGQDDDEEQDEFADNVPEAAFSSMEVRHNRHSTTGASEWTLRDSRKSSVASFSGSSAYPSPYIHSQMDDGSGLRKRPVLPAGVQSFTASPIHTSSATPTPTLLSPAFNSIHFSPDLSRSQTNTSIGKSVSGSLSTGGSSWTSVNLSGTSGSVSNPSPSMQPLPSPKAVLGLPLPHTAVPALQLPPRHNSTLQRERDIANKSPSAVSDASGNAEATASAALMMLTNEWRGNGRPDQDSHKSAGANDRRDSKDRGGKGMSVRDLLSS